MIANRGSGRLHYELIRSMLDTCAVPSPEELCLRLDCSPPELEQSLDALAGEHGVVLHPGSHRVWVIHPFSLAPTPFLVRAGNRRWWGNCAWCSFGIAVLLDEPCTITSTVGAEENQVVIAVDNGTVKPDDLLVHFPIPMARAWDNVLYTCSTMLLFRSGDQVLDWSRRHRIPAGDVQPVSRVLELSRRWYGGHLRRDWKKKTVEEARALFAELGFDHPVWQLDSIDGRF